MTAIEKMRKIVNWADWQNESFNDRFKTIKDLEKAYDYCNKKDIEFLDNIHSYDFEEQEITEIRSELNKLLKYDVYY